jgi:LCP family protein required for cell wall assembly
VSTSRVSFGRPVVVGLVALATLVVIAVIAVVVWLNASLDRVEVDGLGPDPAPMDDPDGAMAQGNDDHDDDDAASEPDARAVTILLLGSDTRESLTPEERVELSTGSAEGERTESIALIRLDPDADTIRMLNVPRDTLITRCDGSRGRINAAYAIGERSGIGGMTCIVQTLTNWSRIPINHVVKVDFRGFVDIVDTLGGVPIDLDEPITDDRANLDLPAGCTRLDGAQSLAFVRARSIDDDFGRQARQQRFLEELRREIASIGMLDEPVRFVRTAQSVASNLEVDDTLTLRRIEQLARQHRTTLRAPLDGRSIPGTIDDSSGTAFLNIDEPAARELFDWLFHGPDDPEGTPRPDPDDDGDGDLDSDPEGEAADDPTSNGQPTGSDPSEAPLTC